MFTLSYGSSVYRLNLLESSSQYLFDTIFLYWVLASYILSGQTDSEETRQAGNSHQHDYSL